MTSACHAEPQAKHLTKKGKRSFVGTQDDKQKTQDSSLRLLACASDCGNTQRAQCLPVCGKFASCFTMTSACHAEPQAKHLTKKGKRSFVGTRMTSKRRRIRHCNCLRAPATEAISLPTNRKAAWSFDSSSRAQRGDLPICGKFAACFTITSACHAEPQAKNLTKKGERFFVGTQDDKQKTQDSSLRLLACASDRSNLPADQQGDRRAALAMTG